MPASRYLWSQESQKIVILYRDTRHHYVVFEKMACVLIVTMMTVSVGILSVTFSYTLNNNWVKDTGCNFGSQSCPRGFCHSHVMSIG